LLHGRFCRSIEIERVVIDRSIDNTRSSTGPITPIDNQELRPLLSTLREQHEALAAAVRRLQSLPGLMQMQQAPAILEQQLALNSLLVASIESQQRVALAMTSTLAAIVNHMEKEK
jgi:hypothetical protein